MTEKVQLEIKPPVGVITLNKSDRLNALDVEMWEDIRQGGEALDENAVYPAGELWARTMELADEIAANAPLAVQAAKRAMNGTYWGGIEASMGSGAGGPGPALGGSGRRASGGRPAPTRGIPRTLNGGDHA